MCPAATTLNCVNPHQNRGWQFAIRDDALSLFSILALGSESVVKAFGMVVLALHDSSAWEHTSTTRTSTSAVFEPASRTG